MTTTGTAMTTGTSMTTTTTTTTTTASTSTGLMACPSQVTTIMGECDLYYQDCPNGDNCLPTLDGNNMLTTACSTPGLIGLGQPCMDPGECQAGLLCIGGACTHACCPETDEPCGVGDCNINATFNGFPNDFIMACSYAQTCTLFDPNSCPNGQDCHIQMTGFASCSNPSGANAMPGQPCMFVNDCGDSQICLGETGPMDPNEVCRWLCQQGSMAAPGLGGCPGGTTCNTSVYDFGFAGVGFCE